jgi:uncharacterized membrane protein
MRQKNDAGCGRNAFQTPAATDSQHRNVFSEYCTTRSNKTHITETRIVHYRWHPWYGRTVYRVPPVWWTVLSLSSRLDLGLGFTSFFAVFSSGFNAAQSDADAAEGRRRIRAERFSNSWGDR